MNIRQVKADLAEARADLNAVIRENRSAVDNDGVRLAVATKRAEVKRLEREVADFKPAKVKRSSASPKGPYGPGYWASRAVSAGVAAPWNGFERQDADEWVRRYAADANHSRASVNERRLEKRGIVARLATGQPAQFRDLAQLPGAGGEMDPPAWLLDEWVDQITTGAPLLALADRAPLPSGCYMVDIPVFDTTAVAGAAPATQNTPVGPDTTATGFVSSWVTLVVAETVVSEQALQQGNIDRFISESQANTTAQAIEELLWSGTGTAEPYGVLNSGIGQVATPGQTNVDVVNGAAAAAAIVGKNRLRPVTHFFGTPERWETVFGYPDGTSDVPLTRTGQPIFDEPVVGSISNRPCVASGGMPSGSADTVVAARPKELLVLTSDPVHEVHEETYAPALSVVIRTKTYVSALVRYPSAFCWVSGLDAPA